jgi:hypothetical protein
MRRTPHEIGRVRSLGEGHGIRRGTIGGNGYSASSATRAGRFHGEPGSAGDAIGLGRSRARQCFTAAGVTMRGEAHGAFPRLVGRRGSVGRQRRSGLGFLRLAGDERLRRAAHRRRAGHPRRARPPHRRVRRAARLSSNAAGTQRHRGRPRGLAPETRRGLAAFDLARRVVSRARGAQHIRHGLPRPAILDRPEAPLLSRAGPRCV